MTELTCAEHQHGSVSKDVLGEYEHPLMGIPVVLHESVEQTRCTSCGEVLSTKVPDLEGLVAAMAILRIKHPLKLRGAEVRFLRKAVNMTAKDLAGELDVQPETVSRWENNKEPIGPKNERFLRLFVGACLSENAPAIDFTPREIIQMRTQSVCSQDEKLVLHLQRVRVKIPQKPQTKYWGEEDDEAA